MGSNRVTQNNQPVRHDVSSRATPARHQHLHPSWQLGTYCPTKRNTKSIARVAPAYTFCLVEPLGTASAENPSLPLRLIVPVDASIVTTAAEPTATVLAHARAEDASTAQSPLDVWRLYEPSTPVPTSVYPAHEPPLYQVPASEHCRAWGPWTHRQRSYSSPTRPCRLGTWDKCTLGRLRPEQSRRWARTKAQKRTRKKAGLSGW